MKILGIPIKAAGPAPLKYDMPCMREECHHKKSLHPEGKCTVPGCNCPHYAEFGRYLSAETRRELEIIERAGRWL